MINSLQGIANRARREKKYRFKNLYTMINRELLLECWGGLKKKAASGVDKVTYKEYAKNLNNNLNDLVERLEKFKLELAEEKTKILNFNKFDKTNNQRFDFLGFEFYRDISRNGKNLVKRRTSRGKLQKALRDFKEWIRGNRNKKKGWIFETLNNKFRGYFNYYGVIGNMRSMSSYFNQAKLILLKWLNRRSQRKSMNFKKFNRTVKRLLVVKPTIWERVACQLKLNLSW